MRTPTLARTIGAALLTAATVACSSTPSGPSGPSVEGTWTGTWGGTAITMTLHQSGSSVTGDLGVKSTTYSLTGDVDDTGRFSWSTEVNQGNCTSFASSDYFQLQSQGDAMAGVMIRAQQALPCGSGTRTAITQADASVTKAF
jgi:hypothetical protein